MAADRIMLIKLLELCEIVLAVARVDDAIEL